MSSNSTREDTYSTVLARIRPRPYSAVFDCMHCVVAPLVLTRCFDYTAKDRSSRPEVGVFTQNHTPGPELARQHFDSQTRNTGSQGIGVFTSLVRDVAMLPHYPRD